ncbi:HXXEE domain-containing protein, partial [Streptococcus mutans]
MTTYVWLFPLLFIFHDLEEIIGFIPWIEKKSDLLKEKAPLLL